MIQIRWAAALLPVVIVPLLQAVSEPLRLDEVAIVRFVETAPNQWLIKHGLLSSRGAFRETSSEPVLSSVSVPSTALNRNLISYEAWVAYGRLGAEAVASFAADPEATHYRVKEREYLDISPSPSPKLAHGRMANLSARGYVTLERPLMGGFVIDDQHRWVLLRAVGPTLATQGVAQPLPDPVITVFRGSTPFEVNDDWSTQPDAAAIAAAAARVGAFALPQGSRDAALLVELPAGAYTAHVNTDAVESGDVLLEVYAVPE